LWLLICLFSNKSAALPGRAFAFYPGAFPTRFAEKANLTIPCWAQERTTATAVPQCLLQTVRPTSSSAMMDCVSKEKPLLEKENRKLKRHSINRLGGSFS